MPNSVDTMAVAECRELLDGHHFGRICFMDHVGVLPSIVPVNYLLDEDHIVIRTDAGSKLAAAVRGAPVAFEVDGVAENHQIGWSVVVRGHAEEVTDQDQAHRATPDTIDGLAPRTRPSLYPDQRNPSDRKTDPDRRTPSGVVGLAAGDRQPCCPNRPPRQCCVHVPAIPAEARVTVSTSEPRLWRRNDTGPPCPSDLQAGTQTRLQAQRWRRPDDCCASALCRTGSPISRTCFRSHSAAHPPGQSNTSSRPRSLPPLRGWTLALYSPPTIDRRQRTDSTRETVRPTWPPSAEQWRPQWPQDHGGCRE